MKLKSFFQFRSYFLIFVLVFFLVGCKAGFDGVEDESSNGSDKISYVGPGSKWDLELEEDGDGFTLKMAKSANVKASEKITGTYKDFSNA